MPKFETNRAKIVKRLEHEGWIVRHGGEHDIYKHPARSQARIVVPRHRTVSPGVARAIAKTAGWNE